MLEHHDAKEDQLKFSAPLDVDFLRNLDVTFNEGYGIRRNMTEMDPFFAKIDAIQQSSVTQGDIEINKLDKQAAEQNIIAARIIQKLNNNSSRIIKSTQTQTPLVDLIRERGDLKNNGIYNLEKMEVDIKSPAKPENTLE